MVINMAASTFEDPTMQAILEKTSRNEGFKQPTFLVTVATKPGDNFIGRVYRAVVTETDTTQPKKSVSLILKASPLSQLRQELLSSDEVFLHEGELYEIVLPSMNKLLKKHGASKTTTFPGTVRCLGVYLNDGSEPNKPHVLVFEDKSVGGFIMRDRTQGLDDAHISLVFDKLALWHGASLALKHYHPEAMNRIEKMLRKDLWFENKTHPLWDDLKKGAVNALEMLGEPYKRGNPIYDRLEKMIHHNFHSEMVDANKSPSDLSCIVHGDCWTNNILFKYDKNGAVKDACLIDLQVSRIGSPVLDLTIVMFICTTKEFRDVHYDNLIRSYYNKLTATLNDLGCDPERIVSWNLLQDHLKRYGRHGVLTALTALPIFLADTSEIKVDVTASDHDGSVFAESAKISDPIKRAECAKRLTEVVTDAARWGYI